MSHWKSFGLAIFVAAYGLGETLGRTHAAECMSPFSICATEWNGSTAMSLGLFGQLCRRHQRFRPDSGSRHCQRVRDCA
jgi:hypothetical protein